LNAANEVAVRAFLDGGISFPGIWEVIDEVMQESEQGEVGAYQEAVRVDGWARSRASVVCAQRRLTGARG
jgi:1-deoxy-D-xylulose-5-phosphate reductoisomerase